MPIPRVSSQVARSNSGSGSQPLRRLKAAAGTGRAGVRVAQQAPHNLAEGSGAVFAAGVAASA
jgi:hypothetical protein